MTDTAPPLRRDEVAEPSPGVVATPRTLAAGDDAGDPDAVVEEVLVEEVSIDGMCGVY